MFPRAVRNASLARWRVSRRTRHALPAFAHGSCPEQDSRAVTPTGMSTAWGSIFWRLMHAAIGVSALAGIMKASLFAP
jgi:hypothetical protein